MTRTVDSDMYLDIEKIHLVQMISSKLSVREPDLSQILSPILDTDRVCLRNDSKGVRGVPGGRNGQLGGVATAFQRTVAGLTHLCGGCCVVFVVSLFLLPLTSYGWWFAVVNCCRLSVTDLCAPPS